MASASDTSVTSGRDRTAGKGIVLAGDRSASRHVARRHSKGVRILKFALPLTAVAAVSVYGLSIMQTAGWGTSMPEIAMPQILPENLAMENPHYEGFNADGGRYWVRAARAKQDLKAMNVITLEGITGELTDAQKLKTVIAAARGAFDNKSNKLELFDNIDISGDNELKAQLTRASVNTKDGIITSDQPVNVAMAAGKITANQMTIRQKVKEYTFIDNVQTEIKSRASNASPNQNPDATKSAPKLFGSSNESVNITANRLDINDATKIATFSGSVTAVQGPASLTAPELEVTYEGSTTTPGKAEATDNNGKLKRLVAQSPVELRQGENDVVTGQTADFDAVTQKAVIDGDVVMTQGPDRRAVGDRAEFDQTADSILLTGTVNLTQGENELRGSRLLFYRATSKMQLTAPTATGGTGRIFARFKQPAGKSADTSIAPAEDIKRQGIAFGATFKTNPDAPVSVEAAKLDVDDAAKQAVFTGDVRAVQGDFIIRSGTLSAAYAGSAGLSGTTATEPSKQGAAQISRMKARDKVQITSNDGQTATGDWADFDVKANTATLGGNVVLTQGKNIVRGTKLVIDMTTGESVIKTEAGTGAAGGTAISSGGPDGAGAVTSGRPSAVFFPGDLKAKSGAKSEKKSAADGWQQRNTE